MLNKNTPEQNHQIKAIKEGFILLKKIKNYKKIEVVRKIQALGFKTNASSFSKITTNLHVGNDVLWGTWKGILQLIEVELGYVYKDEIFQTIENREERNIIISSLKGQKKGEPIFHANGRLVIDKKVTFLSQAQSEIIEFGVTLNTFSNYFFTRSEQEFKIPISNLLQKGINIKCFLVDADCNEARLYFNDRAKIIAEEKRAPDKIKASIRRLNKINQEFEQQDFAGKFQVFTYKHVPTNYFLIVDGDHTTNGKMMISHYIYGQLRANCPVWEFDKKHNRTLFRRYWNAFELLSKNATKVVG